MAFRQVLFNLPTFTTGSTFNGSTELPGSFVYMYLVVPGMAQFSASTPIYIQGSPDGTNFYRFANPETNTNVVAANDFQVASSVSNRIVYIPSFGLRFMKIEVSGTCTTPSGNFQIICVTNQ